VLLGPLSIFNIYSFKSKSQNKDWIFAKNGDLEVYLAGINNII
jgi:hypothetical protein